MSMLAAAVGMNEETGELSGAILAEREVERTNPLVTQEEVAAMEQSLKDGFGAADDAMAAKAVGEK
jgi:hypothetical protein